MLPSPGTQVIYAIDKLHVSAFNCKRDLGALKYTKDHHNINLEFKLVKFNKINKLYKAIHFLQFNKIDIDRLTTLIASYCRLYWKHNYKIEDT